METNLNNREDEWVWRKELWSNKMKGSGNFPQWLASEMRNYRLWQRIRLSSRLRNTTAISKCEVMCMVLMAAARCANITREPCKFSSVTGFLPQAGHSNDIQNDRNGPKSVNALLWPHYFWLAKAGRAFRRQRAEKKKQDHVTNYVYDCINMLNMINWLKWMI